MEVACVKYRRSKLIVLNNEIALTTVSYKRKLLQPKNESKLFGLDKKVPCYTAYYNTATEDFFVRKLTVFIK